jgi:hypothetical protein
LDAAGSHSVLSKSGNLVEKHVRLLTEGQKNGMFAANRSVSFQESSSRPQLSARPFIFLLPVFFPALCQAQSMGSLFSTFSNGDRRQRNDWFWVEPEPRLESKGIVLSPRLFFLWSNNEFVLFWQPIGLIFAVVVNSDFSFIMMRSVLWGGVFRQGNRQSCLFEYCGGASVPNTSFYSGVLGILFLLPWSSQHMHADAGTTPHLFFCITHWIHKRFLYWSFVYYHFSKFPVVMISPNSWLHYVFFYPATPL